MSIDNINDLIEINIESYFSISQKLELNRLFVNDSENYPSYVRDIGPNSVLIATPTKCGALVPIYKDTVLKVSVITSEGVLEGESNVLKIISSQVASEKDTGVWITLPKTLKKTQRREYMRWEFKFPVKVIVKSEKESEEEVKCDCCNLSGGGIAVFTKFALPRFSKLRVAFQYNDLLVESDVKFIHQQYDCFKKAYITGLQFLSIDKKISDKIHKLVILNQLELRRKGLI